MTTPPIAIFYHCRLSGGAHPDNPEFKGNPAINHEHAKSVMREQMQALRASKLSEYATQFTVSINGGGDDMMAASILASGKSFVVPHGEKSETEWPTLELMHNWAQEHPDWAVFYHHSKGVCWPPPDTLRQTWRRCLEKHLVWNWKECLRAIMDGYDMVGGHWLTGEQFPESAALLKRPIWGGNFWWASSNYIRQLPPVQKDQSWPQRYQAEHWPISGRMPKVKDFSPHWPGEDNCKIV